MFKTYQLPLGFGNLDFEDWARGLISAFISGGSGAFAAGVVNLANHKGETIWRMEFWATVSSTFVLAGLLNMFAFLRTKSFPDMKQVERTTQTITPATADTPKVVETIKETMAVKIDPPVQVDK